MQTFFRHLLRGVALLMPALASAVDLPGPVVDAAWLKSHLGKVVVLDVRSDPTTWTVAPEFTENKEAGTKTLAYAGGHIDGALLVDFNKIRVDRVINGKKISKLVPDAAQLQAVMRASGVPTGRPIVITAIGEAPFEIEEAARLYWTLKLYGADQLALLDGGNAAWLQAGLPVSTSVSRPDAGNWTAGPLREDLLAEVAEVKQAINDRHQIIDARPLPQFLGLSFKKPSVMAGGHLPGARNLPTDVRFRARGVAQHFLNPKEYRGVFAAQGIAPEAPTVTYCNTGHMAAGSWFIQSEILGNSEVRLYDGSMHEWTTLGHPVVGLGG
jgi:thiosulfate/3-mercaptopyruvate sulfurtransferase